MKDKPLVSIIILNHNGQLFLDKCLSSVFETKYPSFEVVLVDNASTDGSLDTAEKASAKYGRIKILKEDKNLGYGPANNVGFRHSTGEYIVFLNNDTTVDPNWLTALMNVMEADSTIGLAQSLILNMDGQTVQAAGFLLGNYSVFLSPIHEKSKPDDNFPDVFEISFAQGTSMMIKRDLVREIGLFDPKYFWFYDDTYLSFKTWLVGKRVVTASKSKVYHVGGGTAGFDSPFIRRHNAICFLSLNFDVYWSYLELAKALFIFNYNLIIESLKEVLERKKTTRIWASIYAGCWVIRNLKYIWKNRLRYLSMAKVSQETLLSKFIRIRIPTRIYLVPPPIKLLPQYILNETRKYLETLRTHAKFEVVHKRTNGLKEGYDEFYRSKYTGKDDWIVEDKISSPRRWLSTFAEKEKGQCLAVGCGVVDLKILKHNNPNVLGIDISKVALKRAAESGQTVLADATHLPFLSSSFDFVCVFDVLEHVPQKTELLNEVTRTLKDGGRLYLSVPIRADNTPGDMRQPYDQPPTLSVLLGLLRRNGLRLSIIRPFWGPLNSIPYPTYMSFSFIFSLFPYLLMGATQISLIAVKNIEPAVYLIDFLNRKWSQTASSK